MGNYIVYGAGGHAKVVIDLIQELGGEVVCVCDDKPEAFHNGLLGIQVAKYDSNLFPEAEMIIAIGNNQVREKISTFVSHNFATLIHPKASVSNFAVVGVGTVVLAHAAVQADAEVGTHAIINVGSCVDHDAKVGNYNNIGPSVYIGSDVKTGNGTAIGPGVNVERNTIITDHTFIEGKYSWTSK